MADLFEFWAEFVTRCGLLTLIVSLGLLLYLAQGNRYEQQYDVMEFPFAPDDNLTLIQAKKVTSFLFKKSKVKAIDVSMVVKDAEKRSAPNLLTLEAFAEMIEFEERFGSEIWKVSKDDDEKLYYEDLCEKYDPKEEVEEDEQRPCRATARPIDLVYNARAGVYDLSRLKTDQDLLERIRLGVTEKQLYRHDDGVVSIDSIFKAISPDNFYQNLVTGENNIERAVAVKYTYYLDPKQSTGQFSNEVIDLMRSFNSRSLYIEVGIGEPYNPLRDLTFLLEEDVQLAVYAAYLIVTYTLIFLGSCSPVHCRGTSGLLGILLVFLSVMSGSGLAYLIDLKKCEVNEALPILLLGIGVDDIFVICNAIDQTSLKLSPKRRLQLAMRHAGPSITITSITNSLAFFSGSLSSIPAIRDFCLFSGFSILSLYLSMMTIYMPIIYWDTWRVSKKRGELCGLCFCKENSVLFFKGQFLSQPQRVFSGLVKEGRAPIDQLEEPRSNYSSQKSQKSQGRRVKPSRQRQEQPSSDATTQEQSKPAHEEAVVASFTEKFLRKHVAPELISKRGKVSILFLYSILTVAAIYGASKMKIYYSLELNIMERNRMWEFHQAKEYFGEVYQPTTYVKLNKTIDFWEPESQIKHYQYQEAIQRCTGCSQPWFKPNSIDSWFSKFRHWVDQGNCRHQRNGIDPFTKVMSARNFKRCYDIWRKDDHIGKTYNDEVSYKKGRMEGFTQLIETVPIEDPGVNGVIYLDESREIDSAFGLQETFSFEALYGDLEVYKVLIDETVTQISLALLMVVIVVFFITGNVQITVIVVFCVLLVNLYMLAICNAWGLTLNNIFTVNMSFALGIALDYSSHIATTYIYVVPPKSCKTVSQKREYKARKAISMMGSSVIHGGVSTALAISMLSFAQIYTFQVFFKTWMCIIVFGMLNGIILLPVILSIIGPVRDDDEEEEEVVDGRDVRQADKVTVEMEKSKPRSDDNLVYPEEEKVSTSNPDRLLFK